MVKRALAIGEFKFLEIDDETSELFWKGRRIRTETRLTLTFWQRLAGVIVTISALAGALSQVPSAYQEWRALLSQEQALSPAGDGGQ